MLNYSIMSLDEEHIDEFCADIEYQIKNNIATAPLFSMTLTPEGDPAIDALVLARAEAKKAKNFAEADRIRDELKAQGVEITDIPGGASWKRI